METRDPAQQRQATDALAANDFQQLEVIATTPEGTRAALDEADRLSRRVPCGRIVLLVPHVVSSMGSVRSPDKDAALIESYKQTAASLDATVIVRLCVCASISEALTCMVQRGSLVIVGGHRRWWWPTMEQRIAATVTRAGCRVVFASTAERSEDERTAISASGTDMIPSPNSPARESTRLLFRRVLSRF